MKSSPLKYVLGASLLLTTIAAHASDGTITINGTVGNQTCKINGSLAGQADQTVTLPLVNLSDLNAVGDMAGKTYFQLQLSDCPFTRARTLFNAGTTVDPARGTLINQAVDGSDAQVAILNSSGSLVNLNTNSNSLYVAIQDQSATLQFTAAYYAGAVVKRSGPVNTSIEYSMYYE